MKLEELDRKARKLMTMYEAQHPKADLDRLYLQICEGKRSLIGLEDCVQVEADSLEEVNKKYIKNIVKLLKENLFMGSLGKQQRK